MKFGGNLGEGIEVSTKSISSFELSEDESKSASNILRSLFFSFAAESPESIFSSVLSSTSLSLSVVIDSGCSCCCCRSCCSREGIS